MIVNIENTICFLFNLEQNLKTRGPRLIRKVENGIEPACLSMHIMMANEN